MNPEFQKHLDAWSTRLYGKPYGFGRGDLARKFFKAAEEMGIHFNRDMARAAIRALEDGEYYLALAMESANLEETRETTDGSSGEISGQNPSSPGGTDPSGGAV